MAISLKKILLTGGAGFIGFHLARRLLQEGKNVLSVDNLNDYYCVSLKRDRLSLLQEFPNFHFAKVDLAEAETMAEIFAAFQPEIVVHLAAQAGVRYSLTNPHAYINSNIVGTLNILEGCRNSQVQHLVFASSSSVYGANEKKPFSVHDNVDHPVSLYAASKKANELMAHSYSHLYGIPTTGLRFFSVYGPWGRPDMALFLFTKAILAGETIPVFNYGKMRRDWTYIDDIIDGVMRVMAKIPKPNPHWSGLNPDPATSNAPYQIYNIGNHKSVELLDFIKVLEAALGKKARIEMLPLQPGDVLENYADITDLTRDTGFQPTITIETGILRFVAWYRDYYHKD